MSFLEIFTISPLQRPRETSQNVSGLYYVRRGAGYKIHICAKLYYLGRAKVFSSVATDFGSWTKIPLIIRLTGVPKSSSTLNLAATGRKIIDQTPA